MESRAARLAAALTARLPDALVTVEDQSALHAGHAGARPGGETHYRVAIVSEAFAGLSRVARSRMVHGLLAAEFDTGLHALSLALSTAAEHGAARAPAG